MWRLLLRNIDHYYLRVCTCSLNAAGGYVLLRVELGVIDIAVLHVRDIQPRDVSIVTKYPMKYGHRHKARIQVLKRNIFQVQLCEQYPILGNPKIFCFVTAHENIFTWNQCPRVWPRSGRAPALWRRRMGGAPPLHRQIPATGVPALRKDKNKLRIWCKQKSSGTGLGRAPARWRRWLGEAHSPPRREYHPITDASTPYGIGDESTKYYAAACL